MAPRETENNAYAKFWGDKQRTLWYVMVFLEWSTDFSLGYRGRNSRTQKNDLESDDLENDDPVKEVELKSNFIIVQFFKKESASVGLTVSSKTANKNF